MSDVDFASAKTVSLLIDGLNLRLHIITIVRGDSELHISIDDEDTVLKEIGMNLFAADIDRHAVIIKIICQLSCKSFCRRAGILLTALSGRQTTTQ